VLTSLPGTGKTTICKALAQKVYVRNSDRYASGVLLEVNSHSLFSKWFSESGTEPYRTAVAYVGDGNMLYIQQCSVLHHSFLISISISFSFYLHL
jgi:ATPase family associated with various cellular activities (AAA)